MGVRILDDAGVVDAMTLIVHHTGIELMLFASILIIVFGIGDVLVDILWFCFPAARGTYRPVTSVPDPAWRPAVFIPAWQEGDVIERTLRHARAAWHGHGYRIYVGCYGNDRRTLLRCAAMLPVDPQLRLVINPAPGPTTKAACLNAIWHALRDDERSEDIRFDAVILHDAEDFVDPGELGLFHETLQDHAFVQLPVVPLIPAKRRWIAGHYCDEFAQTHQKDMSVRQAIGAPIPAAGVGCAFRRETVDRLLHRGSPFRADSLVEDYEMGLAIGAGGMSSAFVRAYAEDGTLIAVRSHFPDTLDAAVRQKARWIVGIALSGWDRIGWLRGWTVATWAANWMLWRDRRGLLTALATFAAYLGALAFVAATGAAGATGRALPPVPPLLAAALVWSGALLVWRTVMRFVFTARLYGRGEGFRAVLRILVSNVVAILAARRALIRYLASLRGAQLSWDKTYHPPFAGPDAVDRSGQR